MLTQAEADASQHLAAESDATAHPPHQCAAWRRKFVAAEETLAHIRKTHAEEIKMHTNAMLQRLKLHELHVQGLEVGF